jgi:hypothetical protein
MMLARSTQLTRQEKIKRTAIRWRRKKLKERPPHLRLRS